MRPQDEQSRPAATPDGSNAQMMATTTPNAASVGAATDNGETFTDAFAGGYTLGYGVGYAIGDAHGYDRAGHEHTAALTGVRRGLGEPRQAELDRLRRTLRSCNCGRCSTCCRRAAIERNRRRYGADDYPGRVAC